MYASRRKSLTTATIRQYREVDIRDRQRPRRKSVNLAFGSRNYLLAAAIDYSPDSEVHIVAPTTRYEPQIYYSTQHSSSVHKSATYARLNTRLVELKRQRMFVERMEMQSARRRSVSYLERREVQEEFGDLLRSMDEDVKRFEDILRGMRAKMASGIFGWDGEGDEAFMVGREWVGVL